MFKKLKLRGKLVVFFGLLILITILVQGSLSFIELSKAHDSTIAAVQGEFDAIIRTSVESIIGVLDTNNQRYLDGEITKEQEMEEAKRIVRDSRYNNGQGYFWVDLEDGTCAVHMNPEYEGKQRYNEVDLEGNYFIQNLINAGNQHDGDFTEFYFTKPGEEGSFKKRGFTQKYEPYGWYISTGNYYDDIQDIIDGYEKDKKFSLLSIIFCSIILGAAGIILMFIMANNITKHLGSMTKRLTQLSDGDLNSPVSEVRTGDELETLSIATGNTISNLSRIIFDIDNTMKEFSKGNFVLDTNIEYMGDLEGIRSSIEEFANNISSTLLQINDSSEQVANGSEQVSSGAQALSQGATEQASSTQELSATIFEIASQLKLTAENAAIAKQISIKSSVATTQVQKQMQEMVAAMNEINNTSNEIGKIAKNIDDIAFQTNILALNAAVEAARAGAAGKGFAVVADEVRNLAGKSAESAKSTTALIESSLVAIENGTKIVLETVKSMEEVISGSEKSAEVIQFIADASVEQEHSISSVSVGIEQVSAVVQINSATAEESAAISEELSAQANMLKNLIGNFKLQEDKLSIKV